jgi:hypothetical protein
MVKKSRFMRRKMEAYSILGLSYASLNFDQ